MTQLPNQLRSIAETRWASAPPEAYSSGKLRLEIMRRRGGSFDVVMLVAGYHGGLR